MFHYKNYNHYFQLSFEFDFLYDAEPGDMGTSRETIARAAVDVAKRQDSGQHCECDESKAAPDPDLAFQPAAVQVFISCAVVRWMFHCQLCCPTKTQGR